MFRWNEIGRHPKFLTRGAFSFQLAHDISWHSLLEPQMSVWLPVFQIGIEMRRGPRSLPLDLLDLGTGLAPSPRASWFRVSGHFVTPVLQHNSKMRCPQYKTEGHDLIRKWPSWRQTSNEQEWESAICAANDCNKETRGYVCGPWHERHFWAPVFIDFPSLPAIVNEDSKQQTRRRRNFLSRLLKSPCSKQNLENLTHLNAWITGSRIGNKMTKNILTMVLESNSADSVHTSTTKSHKRVNVTRIRWYDLCEHKNTTDGAIAQMI